MFGPYVASPNDSRQTQTRICSQQFRQFYQDLPPIDTKETPLSGPRISVLKWLCEYVYSLTSPRYINLIFHIISTMINEKSFGENDLKYLCANFLEHQYLSIKKPHHWTAVFSLIHQVIEIVNYKTCQRLLICTLYKISDLPPTGTSAARREIKAMSRVIDRLLDREAPLLPAYISLNEIRQIFTGENMDPPCWALSRKMAQLESSFRPLASIITLKCKKWIFPLVQFQPTGISQTTWINWHLDPEKLCWTQHPTGHCLAKLPFQSDQYEKQYRLLNYILSQRYTIDMALSIFGLSRRANSPNRSHQSEFNIIGR